jgi:hypothetical protein
MRVELNESQMGELRLLIANVGAESNKLLARSLNKTAAKAKTLASVKIRQQVNLKAAYVKSKLTVHKATYGNLSARLSAEKRGVLMTHYPYTLLRRGGATVKIKTTGSRKELPGAFLVNLRAGDRVVQALAWRDPRGGVYRTGNAKIVVPYSPSVSQVFNTVRDDINEELSEYLLTVAEAELDAILRGY